MKLTIQVVMEQADGAKVATEVTTLERETLTDETLGLTLAESKMLLAGVQEIMVAQQAASYSTAQQTCPACGAARQCKGHHQIVVPVARQCLPGAAGNRARPVATGRPCRGAASKSQAGLDG